jgi:hypothetical protein
VCSSDLFISLSLLPGLLFLAFGECRSASWHTHPLIV